MSHQSPLQTFLKHIGESIPDGVAVYLANALFPDRREREQMTHAQFVKLTDEMGPIGAFKAHWISETVPIAYAQTEKLGDLGRFDLLIFLNGPLIEIHVNNGAHLAGIHWERGHHFLDNLREQADREVADKVDDGPVFALSIPEKHGNDGSVLIGFRFVMNEIDFELEDFRGYFAQLLSKYCSKIEFLLSLDNSPFRRG